MVSKQSTILGKTPQMETLIFLNAHPSKDYYVTEIACNTGYTRQTISKILPILISSGLIKVTRTVANVQFYSIDLYNHSASKFHNFIASLKLT
jgi:DNA-binding MarR family transcriptional regulator